MFYVKDIFGMKVDHQTKLQAIRRDLMSVLVESDSEDGAPAGPATPLAGNRPRIAPEETRANAAELRAERREEQAAATADPGEDAAE